MVVERRDIFALQEKVAEGIFNFVIFYKESTVRAKARFR